MATTTQPTQLSVEADLEFELTVDGARGARGRLRGSGRRLELEVDNADAFSGRDDSGFVRGLAGYLAGRGLTVDVVAQGRLLATLGAVRSTWPQRRLTHSRYMRVAGPRAAWSLARSRAHAPEGAAVMATRLAPPVTPWPPTPTLFRKSRFPVSTTHDPERGGNPRLVMAPGRAPWPGDRQPVFRLRPEVTTIGSHPDSDICLPGLEERHAEVRHDSADEFVLVHLGREQPSRVNGAPVRQQILRTGSRLEVGRWTLTYSRDEYADHGRPYGGRIGGELGHQRPQPTVPQQPRPGGF